MTTPRLSAPALRVRFGRAVLALALAAAAAPALAQHAEDETPPPMLKTGEVVAPFDARGVDGVLKKIAFTGKNPTVLLFFLSGCPTCHKMIPEWNRAFQRKPPGLQVIGVLMDQEPPNFFVTTPIAFPVVRSPGRDFLLKLKVSRAPLMLRVGQGGKVEDVAMGYTDPIRVGEVFRP
jgi:hypothetical protein